MQSLIERPLLHVVKYTVTGKSDHKKLPLLRVGLLVGMYWFEDAGRRRPPKNRTPVVVSFKEGPLSPASSPWKMTRGHQDGGEFLTSKSMGVQMIKLGSHNPGKKERNSRRVGVATKRLNSSLRVLLVAAATSNRLQYIQEDAVCLRSYSVLQCVARYCCSVFRVEINNGKQEERHHKNHKEKCEIMVEKEWQQKRKLKHKEATGTWPESNRRDWSSPLTSLAYNQQVTAFSIPDHVLKTPWLAGYKPEALEVYSCLVGLISVMCQSLLTYPSHNPARLWCFSESFVLFCYLHVFVLNPWGFLVLLSTQTSGITVVRCCGGWLPGLEIVLIRYHQVHHGVCLYEKEKREATGTRLESNWRDQSSPRMSQPCTQQATVFSIIDQVLNTPWLAGYKPGSEVGYSNYLGSILVMCQSLLASPSQKGWHEEKKKLILELSRSLNFQGWAAALIEGLLYPLPGHLSQANPHYTATHRNTLQHTAKHCNTLQTLQQNTAHCHTLPHTATHCYTRPRTATLYNIESDLSLPPGHLSQGNTRASALHCTATQCNTVQQTTTRCNMLKHDATQWNAPKHQGISFSPFQAGYLSQAHPHYNATHCNTL